MDNALRTILTTQTGQQLADSLTTYFGMTFNVAQAANSKKTLCCFDAGIEETVAKLQNHEMLTKDQWNDGITAALSVEAFINTL